MKQITRDNAKRRIERVLKLEGKGLRISKSILDKSKYGEARIIDLESGEVTRSKTTIKELLNDFGLILEGEEYL